MSSTETKHLAWAPPRPGEWRIGRHVALPFTPLAAEVHPSAYRAGFD